MNAQLEDGTSQFAWNTLGFTSPYYATAVALAKNHRLFAASWNPLDSKGQLMEWSPTKNSWNALNLHFTNPITQMCFDHENGVIYLAGDGTVGDYVVYAYDVLSQATTSLQNKIGSPVLSICLDTNNNLYVTAGMDNNIGTVMKYNITAKTWTSYGGLDQAPTQVCVDNQNNLYALNSSGNLYALQGTTWKQLASDKTDISTDALAADNDGNLYFNTGSKVYQYSISLGTSTDTGFTTPGSITGTSGSFLLCVGQVVYYGVYGFTTDSNLAAYVYMYDKSSWTSILPSSYTTTAGGLFGMTGYDGSNYNIYVASSEGVLDGKALITKN